MTHPNPRPRTHPLPRLCLFASGLVLLLGLAQPAWAAAPFTVNSDATVTDSTTRLVWDQCPYGRTDAACGTGTALLGNWAGALDAAVAANAARYKGFSDWRVPNINEMDSIVKLDVFQPAIDSTAFPGTYIYDAPSRRRPYYWTSTSRSTTNAFTQVFETGRRDNDNKTTGSHYVRLVRSGQSFASFDSLVQAAVTLTSTSGNFGIPLTLTGGGGSGTGAFSYAVNSTGTAGCSTTGGTTLSATAPGTCTVTATKAADSNHYVASSLAITVTFGLGAQAAVTLTSTSGNFGTPLTLTGGGGSGTGAFSYAVNSTGTAGCSTTGGTTLSATAPGTCTVTATKAADSNYYVASSLATTVTFGLGTQAAVTLAPTSGSVGAPLTLTGGGGGGSGVGAFSYAVNSTGTAGCSITGGTTLNATAVGTCTVTATKAADSNYNAASSSATTVTFGVGAQAAVTLTSTSGNTGIPLTLTGGGGSGTGAFSYAVNSAGTAGCAITGGTTLNTTAVGTCTVTATKAADSNYNAASSSATTVTFGLGTQTITFGAAPSVVVGATGTITTTGGGSGVARVYASTTLAACTVNSSTGVVTGVAAGSSNCTITANQAGNGSYAAAAQASLSFSIGAAPVVTPPSSIALLPISIGGLSTLPAILNMADGEGPAFMASLVGILSNAVGQPLQFVEQNARGTVILRGFNGGNLAFIPYGFQTGDSRADGIYPQGNGQYQVVRNGQQISLAPAMVNLNQLLALLPGIVAAQAGNGVMTATLNGVTYVVQAGVGVQLDPASGNTQLVTGTDGLLHFIDALGNNQVLYPAFSEPGALRNILRGMDLVSTLSVQLDGTVAIVYNGQRYTLVPDMTLLAVPADRVGQDWWQESPTRYRVTNMETFPWRVWSQGFTVKQP